jgi:hypothetical protein
MIGPSQAQIVDNRSAIIGAVEKKAERYGDLDAALVVAVNAVNQHLDRDDMIEALFGSDYVTVGGDPPGVIGTGRSPNGAWYGPAGPRNTRVSAALGDNSDAGSTWRPNGRRVVVSTRCLTAFTGVTSCGRRGGG